MEEWGELKFPVFIREKDEHEGPITPLLYSAGEVRRAAARLRVKGFTAKHLMVVEYRDTSDGQGLFRKYATFRVGERFVNHHLGFTRQFIAKLSEVADEWMAQEELDFVEADANESLLRPIFDLAHIDFGRIDYTFDEGRLVVWEINVNPQLGMREPTEALLRREPAKAIARRQLRSALEELDSSTRVEPRPVPLHLRPSLRLQIARENAVKEARGAWFRVTKIVAAARRRLRVG
jgi:hypothetical protein